VGAPIFGNMGNTPFVRLLREGKTFITEGNVYEEFERCVKRPFKRAVLSIVVLLGNWRGFCYWNC
jgi:hypothetical protein